MHRNAVALDTLLRQNDEGHRQGRTTALLISIIHRSREATSQRLSAAYDAIRISFLTATPHFTSRANFICRNHRQSKMVDSFKQYRRLKEVTENANQRQAPGHPKTD